MREYLLHNLNRGRSPISSAAGRVKPSLQTLQSLCTQFRSDGIITDLEAAALDRWMNEHREVMESLGLGDIPKRMAAILVDLFITDDERAELLPMVDAILAAIDVAPVEQTAAQPLAFDEPTELIGAGQSAVVTGLFLLGARKAIEALLQQHGWKVAGRVNESCGMVLVGSVPSPGWSRGVYGNKIAAVLAMRANGGKAPLLVSEEHWRKLHT